MKQKERDNRAALMSFIVAVIVLIGVVVVPKLFGQAQTPKRYAVVVSPDETWFECPPCKKSIAHLKSRGVDVTVVKMTEATHENSDIEKYPTIFVGKKYVGLGEVQQGVR